LSVRSTAPSWGRVRRGAGVVALLAMLGGAAGCEDGSATAPGGTGASAPTTVEQPAPGPSHAPASGSPGSALAALAQVEVKGRAPSTGYTREQFGDGWVDTDHNGCDTRNDILARDLTGETFRPGTRDCVVLTGTLADPYSGRAITFRRGQGTSEAVQIDHVVALSDAWQKGAQQWTAQRRTAFANDPLNLLAVDGPLNQQKSDGDAATWLPPNRAYRCAYVARQVAVKVTYRLWMTAAERDAVGRVLSTCPGQSLPDGAAPGAGTATTAPTAAATVPRRPAVMPVPTAAVPQPPSTVVPGSVSYANCTAVRAAGAAPIHRGDPGWRDAFDRDGDGIGCE
jgi:Protein of unknown function (DUF1524)/Excalibur calcium-binding domain